MERADPLGGAARRGAEVIQLNLSAPQQWRDPVLRGDEDELAASGLPIFVHAPYLLNCASINPEIRAKSRACLDAQSIAAARIGARGLVVHGGHPTGGGVLADGIAGWLEVLDGLTLPCRVLIENTAGGTRAVARHLDALGALFAALRGAGHDVGFVFDTCHAWAGGMDLDELVDPLLEAVGQVDLVHVNDSKDPHNSGRDRHEHLGDGQLPPTAILELVGAFGAPAVVETPGDATAQGVDIAWLRARLGH